MSEQPGTLVRRSVPRWVWLTIGGLSCVVLLTCGLGLFGWFVWGPGAAFEADSVGETSGASSGGPEGMFSVRTSYAQRGNRLALAGHTQYPGKPKGASYLVLARLSGTGYWSAGGSGSGSGGEERLRAFTQVRDRNGQPFDVAFRLLNDGNREQLRLGDKVYRLDEGRVVLLDLRVAPAAFKQLKTDFGALLGESEHGGAGLRPLVRELNDRDEEIREFWR